MNRSGFFPLPSGAFRPGPVHHPTPQTETRQVFLGAAVPGASHLKLRPSVRPRVSYQFADLLEDFAYRFKFTEDLDYVASLRRLFCGWTRRQRGLRLAGIERWPGWFKWGLGHGTIKRNRAAPRRERHGPIN